MRDAKSKARGAIILGIFSLIFLIVFFLIAPRAKGEDNIVDSFTLQGAYGFKYADVNKPMVNGKFKPGYEYTCVHAAMATALTYAINGTAADATALYFDLVRRIGNKPSSATEVWDNMMNSLTKIPTGYWRYNGIQIISKNFKRNWDDIMAGMLYAGWIVLPIVHFTDDQYNHIITTYGYVDFKDGSRGFIYVDSDDNYYGIGRLVVSHNSGKTYLNFYNQKTHNWRTAEVLILVCIRVMGE